MDWRDLRIALALDRHRTLSGAGRALGMDPTTVGRRITALEDALGARIFARGPEGWLVTEVGTRVVSAAGRMATEVRGLRHGVDDAVGHVRGTVRLTTIEFLAAWIIAPRLPELSARYPELVVDLHCSSNVLDLSRGEADIAVRIERPRGAGLVARRLARVPEGLYGARAYVERRGLNPLPEAVEAELLVYGPPEAQVPETEWAQQLLPNARVVMATNSAATLFEAVVAGVGLGVLPVRTADAHPNLVRLDMGAPPMERALWRVVAEVLRDAPRVRAVSDFLDEVFAET